MKIFSNIDNNFKGLFFMILGQLSFAANDTIVKYSVKLTNDNFSTLNIIFIRGIFTTFFILFIIICFTDTKIRKVFINTKSYLRAIFEVLTAIFFFTGLILMPMANVYTLLMTTPFMVTLFAVFFAKEKVGVRRWSAVIIGFIGVIIVINPQNLEFGYLFTLPIIAAFFLTMRDAVTKDIVNRNNIFEITLITSIFVMIFSGAGLLILSVQLDLRNIHLIFFSSIFLTIAYLFSVLTIFYAPLSLTASIRYSVIVFGIILGYLFLGEIPSINMLIGGVIISASGLFVIKRQKRFRKNKLRTFICKFQNFFYMICYLNFIPLIK